MNLLRRLQRQFMVMLGLAVLVYLGIVLYADRDQLLLTFQKFSWRAGVETIGLVCIGYVFRFARWEYYLRRLNIAVPLRKSLTIFLSGMAMVITPGKVGELLKSYLLTEANGTPMAVSAPVVIAERFTDLFAVVLLALLGFVWFEADMEIALIVLGMCFGCVLLVSVKPLMLSVFGLVGKVPIIGKAAPKLTEMYKSSLVLLHPVPLLFATLLGMLGWGMECLGLYRVLIGLGFAEATPAIGFFTFATGTLTGVASPGGLGITDAVMVGLLQEEGATSAVASGATLVIRAATLWFAVVIGCLTLLVANVQGDALDRVEESEAHPVA